MTYILLVLPDNTASENQVTEQGLCYSKSLKQFWKVASKRQSCRFRL